VACRFCTCFATTIQIRRALFDRHASTERMARHYATRSLRRLFDSGYLDRVDVFAPAATTDRLSRQFVHVLSAAGARVLELEPRTIRRRAPKAQSVLSHDFWLVELAVLALEGCPEGLTITTWWDDRILAGRKRNGLLTLPTIPDALMVVRNASTGKFFPCLIELDLGTASVSARTRARRDVTRKIEGYLDYLGAPFRRDFALDAPAIVLFVTDTEARRDHLLDTARQLGAGGRFWFASLPQLRGKSGPDQPPIPHSAGRDGPFWDSNWLSGHNDGWRSLATRCGV
jgi:hypothetical protein